MSNKQLVVYKQALKYIMKSYGIKMCKSYSPGCPNCGAQVLIGHLLDEVSLIEWEDDQARKKDKAVAKDKSATKKVIRRKRNNKLRSKT